MSFKFTVTTSPAELHIPDGAEAKAAERMLRANLRQMAARLDARGQPLPIGIDLKDSGELQRQVGWDAYGYTFRVEYAEYVEDRYHFVGVAPAELRRAEEEVSAIWDKEPLEIIER